MPVTQRFRKLGFLPVHIKPSLWDYCTLNFVQLSWFYLILYYYSVSKCDIQKFKLKNNLPEVVKALSQYLHLWGFVPVWVLTWFCKEANVLKPLSQTLHLWGRSSECDFMCRDRRYLIQNPRLNGFNNYYYMSTPICTPIDTSYHLMILIICQPTFLG